MKSRREKPRCSKTWRSCSIAQALAAHAAARQAAIVENVANADTPGYRARDLADFADTYRAADQGALRQTRAGPSRRGGRVDRSGTGRARRDRTQSPNGNTVSLEDQMVRAAEVRQREHDLALAVYRKSLDILRTASGSGEEGASDERSQPHHGGLGQRAWRRRRRACAMSPRTSPTPTPPATTARPSPSKRSSPAARTPARCSLARCELDRRELTRIYDPGHPLADETGYYDGSNVDLVVEIADAREAQRSYEANLRMFDQARQMAQRLLDLLRR